MYRYLILFVILLSGCVGTESGNPPLAKESNDDKPKEKEDDSICPSCTSWEDGARAELSGQNRASEICPTKPAILTDEVKREFELSELTAFLDKPYTAEGPWVEGYREGEEQPVALPSDSPVKVEFTFEIGEFEYYEPVQEADDYCRHVTAPLVVHVRVGDDVLNFSAKGSLWKNGDIKAHLYAAADLTAASGSLELDIDQDRPHVGQVEVSCNVFADRIRGAVIPEVFYFSNEEQLELWLSGEGDYWAYEEFVALYSLAFPSDACESDTKFPIPPNESAEFLQGKTPNALLSEAQTLVRDALAFEARWYNGEITTARLDLEDLSDAKLCLDSDWNREPSGETVWEIEIAGWPGARLTSDDGLIDLPVEIAVAVNEQNAELIELRVKARFEAGDIPYPEWSRDKTLDLDGRYDLRGDSVLVDGILNVSDDSNNFVNPFCLGWPVGGEWDEDCQNREFDAD